jgi:hypothetical protein
MSHRHAPVVLALVVLLPGSPAFAQVPRTTASANASVDGASPIQGTWCLDVSKSVLTSGMLDYRSTLSQCLKVDVAGNRVTVVTTTSGIGTYANQPISPPPSAVVDGIPVTLGTDSLAMRRQFVTTDYYDVDGASRHLPWGDTLRDDTTPGESVTRVAKWLPNDLGFEVTEMFFGPWGDALSTTTQRWTLSTERQTLTNDDRNGATHRVLVYTRKS